MGYPWGSHHDDYSSSSSPHATSSQAMLQHGNSYTRPGPPGAITPHPNPDHHPWTTSSRPRWPPVASDNRSTSAVPSKTPLPVAPPRPQMALTKGALAAAVVVPILAVFCAALLIFLCLRRRKQNPPPANAPMVAAAGIKEKFGSFKRRRDPPPPPPPMSEPPVLTSQHNNAYLTGLDTSSIGSRGDSGEYQVRASYEPPPPYIREPSPPSVDARARSPFEDPPENQRVANDMYLGTINRTEMPWSTSNVSVSSTLYSDNASVYEAREARRSTGGAQIVEATSITDEEGDRRASDPFVSPISSPVSATSPGGDEDRRASDVSELDRR